MTLFDGKAVISGIGQSDTGRKTGRSGMEHGIEGCLRAIADAGLEPRDIDGVASYPGPIAGEAHGVRATLTSCGASDQRDLTLKLSHE